MKLPFVNKLWALRGAFARLNPAALIAKIKARKTAKEDEYDLNGDDDDDLFGGLGDLEKLDAEAAENAAEGDGHGAPRAEDAELGDFDEDGELDDAPDDHAFEDQEAQGDAPDALDASLASSDPDEGGAEDGDLVAEIMEDLGDFDLADALAGAPDEEDEDDEEAQKAKLKKLAILAGGGVAVAVFLGAVSWWLLGGEQGGAPDEQMAATGSGLSLGASGDASGGASGSAAGGLVISLDDVPPFADDKPIASTSSANQPGPGTGSPAPDGVMSPPGGAGPASSSATPEMEAGNGELSELKKLGLDVEMEPGVGVVIPSSTPTSYERLAQWPKAEALAEVPVATLVEQGEHGPLPKIGPDGDTPYDAYGRPEPIQKSDDPKIAIIVTGLGMSRAATEAAISGLPADVTLSLDVYARGLDFWVKRAREAGHEVLLNMPGESADFPFTDPGPNALQSLVPPDENIKQLEWILSRTTGYFGVLSVFGSKFLTNEEQVGEVMKALKQRGLMYVDGGAEDSLGTRVAYTNGAKWATVELTLDSLPGRKALALQLQEFETLAQKRAIAIARISPNPGSLEALAAWIRTLGDKKLQLVPVSSLANKQLIR